MLLLQGTVGSKKVTVSEKKIKVGINGFGRIGRNFLRCWHGREHSNLEVVALNDSGGVKQASHLLKYDSILGTFAADVKLVDDEHISVDGKSIRVVSNRDPTKLPWGEMGVDLVIEGTGVFINRSGASKHLEVLAHPFSLVTRQHLRKGQKQCSACRTTCRTCTQAHDYKVAKANIPAALVSHLCYLAHDLIHAGHPIGHYLSVQQVSSQPGQHLPSLHHVPTHSTASPVLGCVHHAVHASCTN